MTTLHPEPIPHPDDRQSDYVLTRDVGEARARLTDWVWHTAAHIAVTRGFAWISLPDAPSTYPEVCTAYEQSLRTGKALPVSSENSGSVIFISPSANYAWRFIHDVSHVEQELSFSLADEWELAMWHLAQLERDGFGPDSLEYAFLKADTLGQVVINAIAKRFPLNQEQFDLDCQHYGFEVGVLREIRRESW